MDVTISDSAMADIEKMYAKQRIELKGGDESVAGKPLTELAELILMVDVRAVPLKEDGSDVQERIDGARRGLAAKLGCSADDLAEIADSYGKDEWDTLVLTHRVKASLSSGYARDVSWDNLEHIVLKKLIGNLDLVTSLPELIAVASLANKAIRRSAVANQKNGGNDGGFDLSVSIGGNGKLPSGDMGVMELRMRPRIREQIEATRESSGDRLIDSVTMLGVKEVQEIEAD